MVFSSYINVLLKGITSFSFILEKFSICIDTTLPYVYERGLVSRFLLPMGGASMVYGTQKPGLRYS